ncbi:MAG: 4'-phosphopantetheinyl transferase superfamily protein [Ignavibacteriae bacterium]|nr:4'-phosphopantetheinyl transferase superfamily protein [Ignavibacteriota bacterium]
MSCKEWVKSPINVVLKEDEVYLWLVNLKLEKKSIEFLERSLNANEIEKAYKFHFEKDKNSFIVARASLRIVLSKYLIVEAKEITFKYNEYGKPFLDYPRVKNIIFNLSYSKDFALIGITKKGEIGVDIEYVNREFVIKDIAKNYFSKNEIVELFNLPEDKQQKVFFSCWTRKEAYIKAEGKGLSIPLDSFDVTLGEDSPKIVRIDKENNPRNWNLYNQDIDENYCAAIANYGEKKNIVNYYVEDATKL